MARVRLTVPRHEGGRDQAAAAVGHFPAFRENTENTRVLLEVTDQSKPEISLLVSSCFNNDRLSCKNNLYL